MKTLDLCQKLRNEVMWRLPKEDWPFIEKIVDRLNDLHYRVSLLENILKVERAYHKSTGADSTAEILDSILNEQYLRGEHEGSS